MSGARPSGQALAVPATPAVAVDDPSGFDPSRIGKWFSVAEDGPPMPEVFVLCWDGRITFVDWCGSKADFGRGVTHWQPYELPPGSYNNMHDGRRAFASADTHPKDGDVKQAPLVSGAVPEGQTPNPAPISRTPKGGEA